jgi:ATP-dependent 26S proteasome regulatory subunit
MAYSREYSTARWENTETNVFLKELEKFEGVCIFATNFKKKFDPAFERRLSLHIEFEKPKEAERLAIWQIHTKKCKLSKGVDFEYFARHYDFSGGDIKNALINAARLALLEGNVIKQNHLEEACNSVKGKENKEKQNYFG